MDLIQSPLLGGDAKAILRQALEPYGLADLADIAYAIQQSGVTDIDQIINDLQGTSQFQQRFPGLIDPKTGEQVATVAEFVSYERTLQQQMATYGITSADIGVPLNALVGNLLQARRSTSEVGQDLQAIAWAKQSPEARRDFYAITGIDPGIHGLAGMILGVAPNLEQAYQQATAAGVDVNEYLKRRYDFENKISSLQTTIGALQPQVDAAVAKQAAASQQLQTMQTARSGLVTQLHSASDEYTALQGRLAYLQSKVSSDLTAAQIAATKAKMATLLQQAKTLTESIKGLDAGITKQQTAVNPVTGQQQTLTGLAGQLSGYQADLANLEKNAPDQPLFNVKGGALSQDQVFEAVRRAQQMHAARFNVGGSGIAQTQPKAGQQTF